VSQPEPATAEQRLEELQTVLGRAIHDLRTPLTIISGFAETLSTHDATIDETRKVEMLDRIRGASVRLQGLIDELLTVNQFEVIEPRVERVRVIDVLNGARDRAVDPSRVVVSAADDVFLETDPDVLGHVVTLLVDNALKYAGDAELSAQDHTIAVRDHGPGIPDEQRADLFERFTRGDHTTPGMGLGLAVARALAALIDAKLELVELPPGEAGAQFEIRF